MKKSINFSEIILWAIMIIPFVYLALIWNSLPDIVPTHFNGKGEPNDWGSKNMLIWLPALIIFLTYGLFYLIPKIDPKGKIGAMGKKYEHIKWIIVGLMVAISILLIASSQNGEMGMSTNILFAVIGLFYVLMGNYFPTIKHNYFMGIRTPWTLENETVWKKTHRMAGGWWMIGGILIILVSLLLSTEWALPVFIGVTTIIALVPIIYSYVSFKKSSNVSTNKQES